MLRFKGLLDPDIFSEIWKRNDMEHCCKCTFCLAKSLLGVYRAAVNLVVLAELEIYPEMYPISMQVLQSADEYWHHVVKSENSDKYDAYLSNLKLHNGHWLVFTGLNHISETICTS